MEIAQIAIPAAMALAADPIASLVDTAFIGHIGLFLSSWCSFITAVTLLMVLCDRIFILKFVLYFVLFNQ